MRSLIFAPFTVAGLAVSAVLFGVKLFAAIDAAVRPQSAYRVSDKQSKAFWVVILVVAVLAFGWGLLGLAGLIAAIVYLVDVRPRLREVRAGRSQGSTYGPYGPW
jgi:hypothetical protein